MLTAMATATAAGMGAVNRAVRLGIMAAVIVTAMILAGSNVASGQDDYVDGPIAEGVSEGPDPSRPIDINDPAGAETIEAAMAANLGRILSSVLGAAMG